MRQRQLDFERLRIVEWPSMTAASRHLKKCKTETVNNDNGHETMDSMIAYVYVLVLYHYSGR